MERNIVGWFEIYVDDMARAKGFYETVFDLQLEELPMPDTEMWAFPMLQDAPGATGALVIMDCVAAGANSTQVYFSCDDCAIEQQRVAANGGEVTREKFSIGEYGFIALVKDSEGNMIGLHSMA